MSCYPKRGETGDGGQHCRLGLEILLEGASGQRAVGGGMHHCGLGVDGQTGLGVGEPATAPERSPDVFSSMGCHEWPWHT